MNMPEDPTSIPFRESGRPIPPVESAWSQMEKKLDISMPATVTRIVLRPWYGRPGAWTGIGAAAVALVVVAVLVFNANKHTKDVNPETQAHSTANPRPIGPLPGEDQASDKNQSSDKNRPFSKNQPSNKDQSSNKTRSSGENAPTRDISLTPRRGPADAGRPAYTATGKPGSGKRTHAPGLPGRTDSNRPNDEDATPPQTIPQNGIMADRRQPLSVAVAHHNLTPASRVSMGPKLTIPVKAADSLVRLAAAKHTKGPIVLTATRSNARYRYIPRVSAGITLRQYLPLPGQVYNDYNSNGTRGVYSDYVPAVFLRAAINRVSYLQAGFGFHSPQYTRDMVIDNESLRNSNVPGYAAYLEFERNSLKKLFYNELDLTYHYQVADRWRLGAGIQFAFLSGGTVESQTILQPANPALTDTVYATRAIALKYPSGYYALTSRKSEWRGILDIEYCWTRWMLGLRYQQSLQSFSFVTSVSPGQTITNGALTIRASYALWAR